jgi:hypothetical protein
MQQKNFQCSYSHLLCSILLIKCLLVQDVIEFSMFVTSSLVYSVLGLLQLSRNVAISDSYVSFIMLFTNRSWLYYAISIDTMQSPSVHGHTLPEDASIRLFCISECNLLEVFSEKNQCKVPVFVLFYSV